MRKKVEIGSLAQETLADGVERRLLEYIRQGQLQVGELLPKEEDLAEALQVSRHIVREGISRLKVLGIVESRKHRGTVMTHPTVFDNLKKVAEANLFTPEECKEFMELRVALELGMANFIFIRKTPEAIQKLRLLAGKPGVTVLNFKEELAFHSALLEISGNNTAVNFREIVYNAFYPVYATRNRVHQPNSVSHWDICNVLESGSAEDFQAIMRKHFQRYLH